MRLDFEGRELLIVGWGIIGDTVHTTHHLDLFLGARKVWDGTIGLGGMQRHQV